MEIAPADTDVAIPRWQAFTGSEATRATTGQTFVETEASRTAPKVARTRVRAKVAA
jgi:hypothetical protein